MSKNTRLLSPASHSSQYVDSSASQSSSSRNANGSYVPPGRIQTLTVSGAAEEEYDNEASRALPEDDDGFKVFPGLFSWPRWWQWVVVILLGVFAALAFTVLKQPLENIGVTSEHLLKYGSIPLISVVFT
jgi:hypothetical protein